MDPPTESRSTELQLQIEASLAEVASLEGSERDAMLLKIAERVGELADIAEGVEMTPTHDRSWARKARAFLFKVSWELIKIMSDTDFYIEIRGSHGIRHVWAHLGYRVEADQGQFRTLAA